MSPAEVLERARARDLAALSADIPAVANAVRAFVETGDTTSALEVVGRAWRVWTASGKVDEGATAAATALDAEGATDPTWRARALYGDGVIAFRAGDAQRSRARNEELLELARRSGDARGEADALTGLARLALREGDYAEVVRLAREGRERARAAGDAEAEGAPLHLEAAGTRLQGRYAEAKTLYLESLQLNKKIGNGAVVAMEKHNLGWVEVHLGDADAAERWFRERDADSSSDAYGDAWRDLNQSAVAVLRGDWAEARRRYDAGVAALQALDVVLDPDDVFERDWLASSLSERAC